MTVNKIDPKKIFASQAPSQDVPAEFNNYERGWDESRKNNGKPTIKQFNKLQQLTDEKILWMHQNGAALPFDETMEYAEGAVVVKDGVLQQWEGGVWRSVIANGLSDTVQTFNTPEAGVDPVTGVQVGDYFNVRSSSDESYIDEYQNIGGSAVATGKRYLSAYGVQQQEKPASTIRDASGKNQQVINDSIKIYMDLALPINRWAEYVVDGDWSPAIQEMLNFAKSTHPQNVVFVGKSNEEYLLKTKQAGDHIFQISGNASIHGNGCKFKINDGFGDFENLFYQPQTDGWQSNDYWEIKDFTINYNTTNNLQTNTNANNNRTAFFLWNYRNGQSNVINVEAQDFLGVWFVTQGNNRNAVISRNKVYYTDTTAPDEDRTVIYSGSQDAEITFNTAIGKNAACHGGIECHGSNQTIQHNTLKGIRYAFHAVGDHEIGGTFLSPSQNSNISFNTVEDCVCFLRIWVNTTQGIRDLTVSHNVVKLDTKCGTGAVLFDPMSAIYAAITPKHIENLNIHNNEIERILNPADLSKTASWISFAGGWSEYGHPIKGLRVTANTFKNGLSELIKVDFGANQDANSGLYDWIVNGNKFLNSFNYTGSTNYSAFYFGSPFKYQDVFLKGNLITAKYKNFACYSLVETTAFYSTPATDNFTDGFEFGAEVTFDKDGYIMPQLFRLHKPALVHVEIDNYLKYIPRASRLSVGSKVVDRENDRVMTCTDSIATSKTRFDVESKTTSSVSAGEYSEGSFVRMVRGGDYLGYSCRYSGALKNYDWSADKSVVRGDVIKISTSFYLAANSGTLGTSQPTAGTVDIVDNGVNLIYITASEVLFETIARTKVVTALANNTVALPTTATTAEMVAAINALAAQDNAVKARLRSSNLMPNS